MAPRPQSSGGGPGELRTSRRQETPDLEPLVRRMVIDAVTAEVVGAFAAVGIPSILLKGPALVRWLYPAGEGRPYLDSDLLVPHADPRITDVERVMMWAESDGRRLDPLALLGGGD